MEAVHVPVLPRETVEYLSVRPGGTYADLTLGLGGHAAAVLGLLGPDGRLIAFDKDADAIEAARKKLAGFGGRIEIIKADFREAAARLKEAGYQTLDGFIMDLGVSTLQLKTPGRGFGFAADAPLDMRMDRSRGKTAAELVNALSEKELAGIIRRYGEERWAPVIARRIAETRKARPIETTLALAEEVKRAIPRKFWPPRMHPATRTFQALRIAVNDELGALEEGLGSLLDMLKPGGRVVVLSYHSLEDRIVKDTFRDRARGCECPPGFPKCVCGKRPALKILTRRPVAPSDEEVADNPSARSAKLRAAERI